MINVSQATKNAYKSSVTKILTISFPNLNGGYTVPEANVKTESFSLDQELEQESYFTFFGCNATKMKVSITDLDQDLREEYVEVSIKAGETESIPLFKGYVDEQTVTDYVTSTSEITAYDLMWKLSNLDVAAYYNHLFERWPALRLRDFRRAILNHFEIPYVDSDLPNDEIVIWKQYIPANMWATDVLKNICQINGVYGIINRDGFFEYKPLPAIDPSATYETIDYYKSIDYQRWTVQGIGKVTVRQNENDNGHSYGNGLYEYIIQNNLFTLNLSETDLNAVLQNVYSNVANRPYVAFEASIEGYPWIELGDILTYKVYDPVTDTSTDMPFYVMSRTLKGIQALRDTQRADGEQNKTIMVSDTNVKIDTIKQQVEEIEGRLNNYSMEYVTFANENLVSIGNGEEKTVLSIKFAGSSGAYLMADIEILMDTATAWGTDTDTGNLVFNDLKVQVMYQIDNLRITARQPQETYQDGHHILQLLYNLALNDDNFHKFKVILKAIDGAVLIQPYQAFGILTGQGLKNNIQDKSFSAQEDGVRRRVIRRIYLPTITDEE